jgi:hypothetical protein
MQTTVACISNPSITIIAFVLKTIIIPLEIIVFNLAQSPFGAFRQRI